MCVCVHLYVCVSVPVCVFDFPINYLIQKKKVLFMVKLPKGLEVFWKTREIVGQITIVAKYKEVCHVDTEKAIALHDSKRQKSKPMDKSCI